MLNRIGSIIGWVGVALVLAAVAIRFLRPEWDRYAYWGAWAGLVCVLVYMLSQWRDIVGAFRRRQTRLGTLTAASILIVLGILVAINYLGSRQNKRWDLTKSGEFTLSRPDDEHPAQAGRAAQDHRRSRRARRWRGSRTACPSTGSPRSRCPSTTSTPT